MIEVESNALPGTSQMIDGPSLTYFAFGLLFFVVSTLRYGIITIHDFPYLIAKSRQYPHADAIHAAAGATPSIPKVIDVRHQ